MGAQSPSSQMSKALIFDSAATLPWLASINGSGTGTGATAAETADVDATSPPGAVPAQPDASQTVRTGAGPKVPVSSTPNQTFGCSQLSWTECTGVVPVDSAESIACTTGFNLLYRPAGSWFVYFWEEFIRFPLDNQQLHRRIKANFMACRYAVHSINTQIVFDATFNILDVVAKWPAGSTRDPRILMESGLRREAPCTSWVSCWVTAAIPARRLDTSQSTTGSTVKV
ncbi:hypothetical protein N1851_018776 [Merluccius polli]|uniref:Uncharacterized protein n=1 Tax=Merluccius polli TaxID=89951 RepID=A0AA47P041_MERPO|nr:hypothetical protein N1851_018776 [Merluccius polli]